MFLAKPKLNNRRLENETGHQMAFEKVDGVRIYDWEIIGKLLEV